IVSPVRHEFYYLHATLQTPGHCRARLADYRASFSLIECRLQANRRLCRLLQALVNFPAQGAEIDWFGRQSDGVHIVQRMRKELDLPSTFTFDACRHGGMTELEVAELTEGQGRALSAHRTQQSYVGYAKRTESRMLSATRKRHAHRLANEKATGVQNERPN